MGEEEIAGVVSEVRAHCASGEAAPQEEFGPADEYARSLVPKPSKTVRTPGRAVMAVGVCVAVIYVAIAFFSKPMLDIDIRELVGPVMLWPALAIIAVAAVVGFAIDRNRPIAAGSATPPDRSSR